MAYYLQSYPKTMEDEVRFSGKVLVIDPVMKKVADLHYMLPGEMRAGNPQEVNIVIWEDCYSYEWGYYQGTTIFNSRLASRTAVNDLVRRQVLAKQEFIESEMHEEIHVGMKGLPVEDTGGDLDKEQMVQWLLSRYQK